tara:strand:+ start:6279 stop:6560 length:282 start_codon:yes stop_codon:yes gene_type:complete
MNKEEQLQQLAKELGVDYKITVEKWTRKWRTNEYEWTFNWVDGGFNTEWAFTKEEAIAKANASSSLVVDENTVRKTTERHSVELVRMGNMMSN